MKINTIVQMIHVYMKRVVAKSQQLQKYDYEKPTPNNQPIDTKGFIL